MHPWLFNVPPISTYGACIVCGLILAWLIARKSAKKTGLDPSLIDLLVPLLVGAGIAGSYAFGRWTDAATDETSHGVVLVGAMIFATLAGLGYALIARIPLGLLGDIFAVPAAVGIACGRIGCFFAGCCYGKISPSKLPLLAVRFPRDSFAFIDHMQRGLIPPAAATSLPLYPVQLYESALCLALACALAWKFSRRQISGERFLALGIGYALIRFPMEFLRADNPAVVGGISGLTFSQVACVAVLAAAGLTMAIRRRYAATLHLHIAPHLVSPQG